MNNVKSEKYKLTSNEIEKKSLENQQFRTEFNFEHIKISKKTSDRLDRYHKKLYSRKKKKLREELNVGEKVLILAERLQRKPAPGKFYKQSVQNIFYFNKENIFIIRNKRKIEDKTFYWLKTQKTTNISTKGFKGKNYLPFWTILNEKNKQNVWNINSSSFFCKKYVKTSILAAFCYKKLISLNNLLFNTEKVVFL